MLAIPGLWWLYLQWQIWMILECLGLSWVWNIGLWIFATGNRGMYFLETSASDTLFHAVALSKYYCVCLKTGGSILTLVSEMMLTNYFLAVQSMLIHLKDRTKLNFIKTREQVLETGRRWDRVFGAQGRRNRCLGGNCETWAAGIPEAVHWK